MKLSVLVSARKNSKYLAKFLFSYFENTTNLDIQTEILVMINKEDTWNNELVKYFSNKVKFYKEDYGYGRDGLHVYFNDLLDHSTGDWIIYFCEDHYINLRGWDSYIAQVINGGSRALGGDDEGMILDHNKPYILVPKFDNAGSMNHIVSRGYINAMEGKIGRHGWIDSYINDVIHERFGMQAIRPNNKPGDIVIKFDDEMFHDFTHDHPNPMSDEHLKVIKAKIPLPEYQSVSVKEQIIKDAKRLEKYEI